MGARDLHRLVLVAPILALASCGSCSSSSDAPATVPGIVVVPAKETFGPGEKIVLGVTLTNTGSKPCSITDVPEGAVLIVDAKRDGTPLRPRLLQVMWNDGFWNYLQGHWRRLAPGEAVGLQLVSSTPEFPPRRLKSETMNAANGTDAVNYELNGPGRYDLLLRYRGPVAPGFPSDRCEIWDTANVSFQLSGTP